MSNQPRQPDYQRGNVKLYLGDCRADEYERIGEVSQFRFVKSAKFTKYRDVVDY